MLLYRKHIHSQKEFFAMIYQPKEVLLKNNTIAIFRSPTKHDAAQMMEYLHTTCKETNFLTREPEEAILPIEKEERFLNSIYQSKTDLMIACEINGKIIGNCNLNRYTKLRMQHRAEVGIAICKEFLGLGIGNYMFSELIRISKELGIKQLELEVIADNNRAIKLYEKFGFYTVGEKPNSLCLKDGTMLKELSMIKVL